ncbi:MAG: Hpt domain-containing protein [Pseudomonadota bacterium]
MSASKQDLTVDALGWISDELANIFASVGRSLEQFEADQANKAALAEAAASLHGASGALHMVEVHGAALLTEEMVRVTEALKDDLASSTAEALDALSRALLQAPVYLERVARGGHDIPLILLPLLNELRATRGRPILSESSLFVLNADRAGVMPPRPAAARQGDIRALADKLRGPYQGSLLNWLRNNDPDTQLTTLTKVAERFREAAETSLVFQTWWVIGGVLEAIVDGGLKPSASIKRLLGQGDRQIKRLATHGEKDDDDRDASEAFLNNLLYYVGLATSDGEQVTAIRKAYGLHRLAPDGDARENSDALAAPSVNLMQSVGDAIGQDLADIKDAIDIHVRVADTEPAALLAQCDALTKIANTLSVLGLPEISGTMRDQSEALGRYARDGGGEEALLEIAAALIQCEKGLRAQLVERAARPDAEVDTTEEAVADAAVRSDHRQVVDAVLRECVFNLTKIKDSLAQLVVRPEHGGSLDDVPEWLDGIRAALLMLEKHRARDLVGDVGWHVAQLRQHGLAHLGGEELDRLADAIVSLEYYMETVRKGRRDPDYMLDNAARCLGSLSKQPGGDSNGPSVLNQVPDELSDHVPILTAPVGDTIVVDPPVAEREDDAPAVSMGTDGSPADLSAGAPIAAFQPIEQLDAPVVLDGRTQNDPELLELFIEEAKEEMSNLSRQLPRWRADIEQRGRLLSVRRSYHTLKGSGRMVGARIVAEFSWTIESLLNAVIDGAIDVTDPLHTFLADAQAAVLELIEQLETGTGPKADVNGLIETAAQLREGRIVEVETLDEAVSPDGVIEMDPVLLDIFRNESDGHLEAIEAFVARGRESGVPQSVAEDLHRAWHTLRGSANMAAVQPIVGLATPLNEYLRELMHVGGRLELDAMDLIGRAAEAVRSVVRSINSGDAPEDLSALLAEVNALYEAQAAIELAETDHLGATIVDKGQQSDATTPGFDPEIAALYAEEAEELLAASDPALDRWLSDPDGAADALAELLRHLHTLKGGARMAGIASMATLSHEIESVFEDIRAGERVLAATGRDTLRQAFDRLHNMREQLAGQVMPPSATDMIETLHVLGDVAPEEAVPTLADVVDADEAALSDDAEVAGIDDDESGAELDTDLSSQSEHHEVTALEDAEPAPDAETDEADADEMPQEPVSPIEEHADAAGPAPADAEEGDGTPATADGADSPARQEMADMASEMAELVEELGDAASAEQDFAVRLAAATQTTASGAVPVVTARDAGRDRPADIARIDARVLDDMLNNAGEVSIFQARIEQEMSSVRFNLTELSDTVTRLREQLRKLDAETEAQIRFRHQDDAGTDESGDFDPLELDRYSTMQQLSRALGESVSDLVSLQTLLTDLSRESENLLTQQTRVTTELQDALIRTRMLPFSHFTPRLERVVRSAARDMNKRVDIVFEGAAGELDRQVLQRMMPAFEHLLRNAVAHGIESPDDRRAEGKAETGHIRVSLRREGTEMAICVADDGSGLNIERIRRLAVERGLLEDGQDIDANGALNVILSPGFSTATEITQDAGRGVGMDVVANEIKLLGGSLSVESTAGQGTEFTARLPLTLAVTQALLVRCGDDQFALPLPAVEGIVRVSKSEIERYQRGSSEGYVYGDQTYRVEHLNRLVGAAMPAAETEEVSALPLVLIRAGNASTALLVDEMVGSREIVVKPVGPLVSGIPGLAGATILGDGSIVMILDIGTLVRRGEHFAPSTKARMEDDERPLILVVDDSITVRRVTQRLLERHDMRVLTAKDGLDAVTLMADTVPSLVLLDIEMPRMDGYEVATHIRNSDTLRDLPIVMVTSRTGEKHRARAFELGVDRYLGKPYQEAQLLDTVRPLLNTDAPAERQGGA